MPTRPLDTVTYTNDTTNRWYTNPVTLDYSYWTPSAVTYRHEKTVTQGDLDKFAHKIYKVITEHVALDISEDEFMKILKEDD